MFGHFYRILVNILNVFKQVFYHISVIKYDIGRNET